MSPEQPPISNPAAGADEQTQNEPSISTAAADPSNPASSTSAPGPRESGQAKEKKPVLKRKYCSSCSTSLKRKTSTTCSKCERLIFGLGVLDFEHWRPMWDQNWGGLNVYRTYSRSLERRKHPFWLNYMIENEATNRYEMMAKAFLLSTLKLAKRLRPDASWGYYGYPFCFNFTPNNYRETCSTQVQQDNDNTGWLFDEMTAYYPSLYLRERELTAYQRKRFVRGRLAETTRLVDVRIRNGTARPPLVFPYVWFKYHDTRNFMTPEDMLHVLSAPAQAGARGVVIWGASRDVNSREKCEALVDYVDKVLGPAVQQVKAGGARRRRQPRVHHFPKIEMNRLLEDEKSCFHYLLSNKIQTCQDVKEARRSR
ncbi:hypothetical protein GE061_001782 [Apolygus lucorum]|uniref:Hyaluronidase n=1 Tax=Apolygus lucorum TaxID=248454 RepID=A0A6A4JIB1_APOLU|nr:hypothetical protein GE061_001782 [Apolygus lucorum]